MPKTKYKILRQLHSGVDEYINRNPDCTRGDIEAHFGKPESVAEQYAALVDADCKKRIKIFKIMKISVLTVLSVLLIYALSVCIAVFMSVNESPSYYYEILLHK